MGIFIDLILILLIFIFAYMGYRKGLTGSLIKLFSFIIALILTFILYKPISDIVTQKTQIDEKIKETITMAIEKKNGNTEYEIENENIIESTKDEIKNEIIEKTSNTTMNVFIGILVFLIARFILFIISLFIKQITQLPIIKQVDELGGIVYGFIEVMIIIYAIFAIISLINTIWNIESIIGVIEKTILSKFFYNNNLIINLFIK